MSNSTLCDSDTLFQNKFECSYLKWMDRYDIAHLDTHTNCTIIFNLIRSS